MNVDEKVFGKGHRYHTIVYDLERSTMESLSIMRELTNAVDTVRNQERAPTAIAFQCGGLDLYPKERFCIYSVNSASSVVYPPFPR
jgi:hypothetical protein